MANTYTLVASNTLSSSAASVTFSSIPSTYTDLVVRISARRDTGSFVSLFFRVNGSTGSNFSTTYLQGNGATAASLNATGVNRFNIYDVVPGTTETSNTFNSIEIYVPNYTAIQNKPMSGFGVGETNATTAYILAQAGLRSVTDAITSIEILPAGGNFVSGSSFFLYGLKNS